VLSAYFFSQGGSVASKRRITDRAGDVGSESFCGYFEVIR
jgi:hypothetical protein